MNNNSSGAFQPGAALDGGSAARAANGGGTFGLAAFSLPEASLDRLGNENLGKLFQAGAGPVGKPTNIKKKIGKIMTIAGLGAAGVGTIMLVANGGHKPNEIGDSGMGINWQATGIAWIGVGLAVTIAGIILLGSK